MDAVGEEGKAVISGRGCGRAGVEGKVEAIMLGVTAVAMFGIKGSSYADKNATGTQNFKRNR